METLFKVCAATCVSSPSHSTSTDAEGVGGCEQLYDSLEEHLQKQLREPGSTPDAASAAALLEELRLRFYRLVG